jgi:hypothetical protein
MAALSSFNAIETALIVQLNLPSGTVFISDYNTEIELSGNQTVIGLGRFVNIGSSTSEIRTSSDQLTITLSGIPNSSISEIINGNIKGSRVTVTRVFIDPETGELLDVDEPNVGRFFGIIVNYGLEEDWDTESRTSSNLISIICSSLISVLENKYTGRRTNAADQKKFFPGDISMDRVAALENTNFQFGASS